MCMYTRGVFYFYVIFKPTMYKTHEQSRINSVSLSLSLSLSLSFSLPLSLSFSVLRKIILGMYSSIGIAFV